MTVFDSSRLSTAVIGVRNLKWLRRTIVASSSLLVLAMRLDAAAVQTCGLPVNGIANCGDMSYPSGIAYDNVDDLTINVGIPAGQSGTVTVDGTIVANDMWHTSHAEELLQVGSNVTIRTAGRGESILVYTSASHIEAVSNAAVINGAVIATSGMGGAGITAVASTQVAAYLPSGSESVGTSAALASINNSGLIVTSGDYARGVSAVAQAFETFQGSYVAAMTAVSQVHNTGGITTIGGESDAIYAGSSISGFGDRFYEGLNNRIATTIGSVDEADLTISNTGDLRTSGSGANGINAVIDAWGYSDTVLAAGNVANSGAIDTTGDNAAGIKAWVRAEGNGFDSAMVTDQITITNSGAVTTRGNSADGIAVTANAMAWDRGASAIASATLINNSGAISTSGDYAEGIRIQTISTNQNPDATSVTATGTVTNTGKINTAGSGAIAIDVSDTASGVGTSLYAGTIVVNSGDLTTAGENAFGLGVQATAKGFQTDQAARAKTMVRNDGTIMTAGGQADAMAVTATAQGSSGTLDAIINATNTGAITTSGAKARGLLLSALASGSGGVQTASITANNSGAITTLGDIAAAIRATARATGAGGTASATIAIENSGNLKTGSYSASGIYITAIAELSGGASVQAQSSVTNSASITTRGDFSYGISAIALAGDNTAPVTTLQASVTVSNSGTINTSGNYAHGITIMALSGGDAGSQAITATADNSGTIVTSGGRSRGIWVDAAAAEHALTASAWATVKNSGAIRTTGVGSLGISADSETYGALTDLSRLSSSAQVTNMGQIITSGDNSSAIQAKARLYDGDSSTVAGTKNTGTLSATVDNTGNLTTTGSFAAGILTIATAKSYGGNSITLETSTNINNSGTISTSGTSSSGISASTLINPNNVLPTINSQTNITNSGTIMVSGDSADGISATASINGVPAGSGSALAVVASIRPIEPDDPGSGYDVSPPVVSTGVSNSGSIVVSGRYGTGVVATVHSSGTIGTVCNADINDCAVAAYIQSTSSVKNSGQILVSGYGGTGIIANADTVMIDNLAHGTITGGTGSSAFGIVARGSSVIVTNAGTISSANDQALMLMGTNTVSLTNGSSGKIAGFVTLTSPSTTFENDGIWTARGGDSDFTPTAAGSSIVVNKGTVLVVGNQTFKGLTEFDNAGVLSLSVANASGSAQPTFEKLEITGDFTGHTGSIVEIGSNMTTAADQIKIDGAVSGTTTVVVDEQGSPGLTTGNGIAIIDVSSGTTSASNFKLAGNTTAGTLVDGAYEYALNLVAGSSGHGVWFLASRIYPGVGQFGQLSSSSLLISEYANGPLTGLLQQDWGAQGGPTTSQRIASNNPSFVPSAPVQHSRSGFWGGYGFAHMSVTPGGAAYGGYTMDVSTGHLGANTAFEGNGRMLIVGLEYSPVDASIDFNQFGSTHIDTHGSAVSGSVLWIEGPWRAGLKYSSDRLRAHFTDDYLGTDARVRLGSYGLQIGGAYTGHFDDVTYFEPWATLSYVSVGKAGFMDGAGDQVDLDGTHNMLTRLGARIGRMFDLDAAVLKPYAEFAVDYRFGGDTKVTVGNYTTRSTLAGATVRGGGGVDAMIGNMLTVFGDIVYFGGGKQDGWQGSIGVRLTP